MTSLSRRLRLGAGGLLLALPVVAVSPADAATTTVDCSAGPVSFSTTATDVVLVGHCSRVTVTGPLSKVRLVDADEVVVDGPGVELTTSGTVRSLRLTKQGGGAQVVSATVRRLRADGATLHLTAAKVGTLVATSPYADVRVGKARRAVVRAPVSTLRFDRLSRLDVSGSTTTVVVRRGSTAVRDTGFRTTVKVHRRR